MITITKHKGFTLVEIIVVIAILGIVGGLATVIIGRTLESYAALERRQALQTSIRLAVERISRELRHALPNSVCVNNGAACLTTGSGSRFYFVPIKDSGRYQDRPGVYVPGIPRRRLPVTNNASQFDVLSTNQANPLKAVAGDHIVVYNQNFTDVYAGTNNVRHPISAIVSRDIHNDGDASTDINQVQFGVNLHFATNSPLRRFHVIDNTKQVTLFYCSGSNLYRENTTFSAPNTATASSRLLLENIQSCSFTYTDGSLSNAALLEINITVANQGETIQVIHNAHIYNVP